MSKIRLTNNFWFRWGPALVLMAAIFIFSSIPAKQLPEFSKFDLSLKKGGHLLGYALLGQAYVRGLGRKRPGVKFLAWILAVLYAISDEFHQSFVPGRNPWVVDIGIDSLGVLIGFIPPFNLLSRF